MIGSVLCEQTPAVQPDGPIDLLLVTPARLSIIRCLKGAHDRPRNALGPPGELLTERSETMEA